MTDAEHPQPEPDFAAEGLLEGLEERSRAARLRLLRRLYDDGVPLEELKEAVAEDRLVILPAERALGGDSPFSARQIAEKAQIPLDYLMALRRAQGLTAGDPDEPSFGEADLEAVKVMAGFYEAGLDREGMLEPARVLGRGMAQLADALGTLFGQTFLKAGVTEEELGLRNAQAAGEMLPRLTPILEYVLRQHMRERLHHQAVTQAMLEAGELPGAREVAVSFSDLVSFTRLGERLDAEAVGGIAMHLGEVASECAEPPVRLVKLIGDAAMLVAPDPEALVTATLRLVAEVESIDELPQLRAGAAFGLALNRSGDWYGRPVNLASRVTGVAEPGTLVVTKELCAALGQLDNWAALGPRSLKGIDDDVELFRAQVEEST